MKFNKNDVNQQKLQESVQREAEGIFRNNARGRSFEKVCEDTEKGHIAERYLIEVMGYSDNPKDYHDVIDTSDIEVEVKVIDEKWCNDYYIEQDPNFRNLKKWKSNKTWNDAKKVVVFSESNGNYKYYGTYDL